MSVTLVTVVPSNQVQQKRERGRRRSSTGTASPGAGKRHWPLNGKFDSTLAVRIEEIVLESSRLNGTGNFDTRPDQMPSGKGAIPVAVVATGVRSAVLGENRRESL